MIFPPNPIPANSCRYHNSTNSLNSVKIVNRFCKQNYNREMLRERRVSEKVRTFDNLNVLAKTLKLYDYRLDNHNDNLNTGKTKYFLILSVSQSVLQSGLSRNFRCGMCLFRAGQYANLSLTMSVMMKI